MQKYILHLCTRKKFLNANNLIDRLPDELENANNFSKKRNYCAHCVDICALYILLFTPFGIFIIFNSD